MNSFHILKLSNHHRIQWHQFSHSLPSTNVQPHALNVPNVKSPVLDPSFSARLEENICRIGAVGFKRYVYECCHDSESLICVSKCMNPNCGEFYWHNAETPLSDIPFDVQLNFTLRSSSIEAPDNSGLSCPHCQTCRANKGCQQSPPHCSTCCKAAGGCRIHRVTSGNQPSSSMGPPNEGKLALSCILNRWWNFDSSS